MDKLKILSTGYARYKRMLANTPDYMQGVVERYGNLVFDGIEKLPLSQQWEVMKNANRDVEHG